jgi:hypothetical protein
MDIWTELLDAGCGVSGGLRPEPERPLGGEFGNLAENNAQPHPAGTNGEIPSGKTRNRKGLFLMFISG